MDERTREKSHSVSKVSKGGRFYSQNQREKEKKDGEESENLRGSFSVEKEREGK